MIRRLTDAHLVVTDPYDVRRCARAITRRETLSVQGHNGLIIFASARGMTLAITLRHSGPPSCTCAEEVIYEH